MQQPNLIIRPEDIRANPELWIQKINVILFNDPQGKNYWNRSYTNIPHYQRYNEAMRFLKETEFEEYNCRIVKNENNEIEIITKNAFGKPAAIHWQQQEIIRKIKQKLGEVIRNSSHELEINWKKWKNINSNFTQELVREWINKGFTYEECVDWININHPAQHTQEIQNPAYYSWLRDAKKLTPDWVLNYGDEEILKTEYLENSPRTIIEEKKWNQEEIKELKELGKSNNPEEFLASDYRDIYEEEAEELERLKEEKENLGTDQTQTSYDLMRPDLAILWRKQLYFVINARYINNYKLTVQIRARKCPLSIYYWNWQRSRGRGVLKQGPVIKEDNPNPDGTPKNLMQSQRMHYEFCSNLGIKRIYQSEFASYQPRFSLFRAIAVGKKNAANNPDINNNPFWVVKKLRGDVEGLCIPSDVYLTRLANCNEIMDALKSNPVTGVFKLLIKLIKGKTITRTTNIQDGSGTITEQEGYNEAIDPQAEMQQIINDLLGGKVFLTIGPREHDKGGSFFSKLENYREIIFKDNPSQFVSDKEAKVAKTYKEWLKKQPHLWDHTTFQFYFFNDITMTANGQYLGIEYNKDKNQFELPYKLFINHAPGILVYRWKFKDITVKCEIKCVGSFQDNFAPLKVITSFQILGTGVGINPSGIVLDSLRQENQTGNSVKDAQTDRMFKSTLFDPLSKSVEPAMFRSDTVDFHYSLNEFFTRLIEPLFFYRIHISELLFNNLCWANNRCKVLNLPLQWDDLSSWTQGKLQDDGTDTRKLGYWKWRDVLLLNSYNGFFTDIMNRGYWLDGGEEIKNPQLTYQRQEGYIKTGGNEWDTFEAEEHYREKEITETIETKKEEHADSYDNITKHDNLVLFTNPPYIKDNNNGNDILLGLLQQTPNWRGGSGYSGWNYGGEWTKEFTIPAGTYNYFWKVWTGPEKSGNLDSKNPIKVKLHMRAGGGLGTGDGTVDIDFEWTQTETITKKIRESYFVEKKTTTQEIDEDKLEQEGEIEEEIIEEETLKESEIEKVEGERGIGSQKEISKEKEYEQENEDLIIELENLQEQVIEKEIEVENENETEAERLERERQEQERQEQERLERERQEWENQEQEQEGEEEIEEL